MSPGHAASTHIQSIAENLEPLGWAVTIVAVKPVREPVTLPRRAAAWTLTLLRAVVVLLRTDVVYLRSHPVALPLVVAARFVRVPVVVEVNGADEDYLAAWPQLRRVPWTIHVPVRHQLRAATAVVAVTDGLARWAEERADGPVTVIPNGVDATRFTSSLTRAPGSDPYVVFVGALAPWQGISELLAAAEHPRWPPDLRLTIAGDGAERPAVEAAAARRPDRITWLGHVPPARVPDLVGQARAALVLSHDRRGTGVSPIKLYEAMAAATPVVVADVPGASATVRSTDCGVVVPVGDVSAIADAVRHLVDAPEAARAMGQRGRSAALHQHTWAHRATATNDVLTTVLRPGNVT